jgi:hypothetical protein
MDPNDHTASNVYGFSAYTHTYPGGMSTQPVTEVGSGDVPSGVLPSLGFGPKNPLFWVLLLFLIITGYLTFGFDIGLKKLGSLKVGT